MTGRPSDAAALEKGAHQIGDIFRAFAQWREANRHNIEAEEQILAKGSLLDGEAEVLVCRGDDPDVGLDRRPSADGRVFALLQDAKKPSLGFHRHIADFVEKQGPAFRLLKASHGAGGSAGEGALLVAEEFALDKIARNGGHVDGHEWSALALAVVVQRPRDQFLAGAGLARNHDREIGLHQPRQNPKNVLHRRGAPDDRHHLDRGRGFRRLAPPLGLCERAPDDRHQFAQVEGLGQIFVSAALRSLDRGDKGILRAHDDDRQIGPHPLDARQEIERVVVGHHDVGDDEIALARRHPSPEPGDRSGRSNLIAGASQRLIENCANPGVVIGDKNMP